MDSLPDCKGTDFKIVPVRFIVVRRFRDGPTGVVLEFFFYLRTFLKGILMITFWIFTCLLYYLKSERKSFISFW